MSSPLDILIRKQFSLNGGAPVTPERAILNIVSSGATLQDNPSTKRTDLTLSAASPWTFFTAVLQTSDVDFVLGTGSALGKWRSLGTEREVEIALYCNGGTNIGTGLLFLPIAASSPPTINVAQLSTYPGDSRKILQCYVSLIDDAGEDSLAQTMMARISGGLVAVDTQQLINIGLPGGETPANHVCVLFRFSVPVL